MIDYSTLVQLAQSFGNNNAGGGQQPMATPQERPGLGPIPSMGNMNFGSAGPTEQSFGNNASKLAGAFSNSFNSAAGNKGILPQTSSQIQPSAQPGATPGMAPARPEVGPYPGMGNLNFSDLMARFGRQ